MRKRKVIFLTQVILFAFIMNLSSAYAETIILKSGRKVEGKIVEKTDQYIKVDFEGLLLTYYFDEIKRIEEESSSLSGKESEGLEPSVIISKMIDVCGGLEKWQAIEGWSSIILIKKHYRDEILMCKHYIRLPDKFRFDAEVNRGGKKEVFQLIYNAGTIKYLKDGKEAERTSSEMFFFLEKTLKRYQRLQAPAQFKYFNRIKNEINLIGRQTIEGSECYVLEYGKSEDTKQRIFVDTKTFRGVKLEVDKGYNGKFIEVLLSAQTLKENGMEVPVIRWVYNDKEFVAKLEFRSLSFALPDESLFEF
ncbi:MAG: hypothetical protein KAS99_01220 [Candidatus Omnitrophica bacterium]|nr:hypothetical protein [Candidatus Omnitrophota bacterium]